MTGAPDGMPRAPDSSLAADGLPEGGLDLLADVLRMIHLSGAIFFRGEFSAPWGLVSPGPREIARVLAPEAERLVLFHVVAEGECEVALDGRASVRARPNDVVVLPYCDEHAMGSVQAAPRVPVEALLPPPPWRTIPVIRHGGGGATTRILCGYLQCEDLLFNPLLRALPPLVHVRPPAGPATAWLEASIRYAIDEAEHGRPGGATLLARLPELLFVECLRLFAQDVPARPAGWLAALHDEALGRALIRIHAEPAREWTVSSLARAAAVSRSILAERFSEVLGTPPMRYVARWRLQLASHRLRTTEDGLAAIARDVGYESEAAFGRAFKRHVGSSPGAWRARQAPRQEGEPGEPRR